MYKNKIIRLILYVSLALFSIVGYSYAETVFWDGVHVTKDTVLEPMYTPRDDTAYTVKHYKQALDGTTYEEVVADTQALLRKPATEGQGIFDDIVNIDIVNY